jgi:hypothetical protein
MWGWTKRQDIHNMRSCYAVMQQINQPVKYYITVSLALQPSFIAFFLGNSYRRHEYGFSEVPIGMEIITILENSTVHLRVANIFSPDLTFSNSGCCPQIFFLGFIWF